ncbi:MAG: 4-hydroxy-3-methylbut-2-enyl diphosphate reductase [Candidatus Neomarinimicrobiota bacterium]
MKIIVAKDAGYCFGVREAVSTAFKAAGEYGEVFMLGDIVHNENVVNDLAQAGAKVVTTVDDVPKDKPVLFRAHGTATSVLANAQARGMKIIDATCPLVRDIHEEVRQLAQDGYRIFIIGDHGHDEVIGIASQVPEATVFATPAEAGAIGKIKRAGVVSQSTQTIENVQEIINILMNKVHDLRFINTICFPTTRNQEQIKELAATCEVVVIIGSFTSANSKRLTQLALERNRHSYQVTGAADLNREWFKNIETVGISAGASTPDSIIAEVTREIEKIASEQNQEINYG